MFSQEASLASHSVMPGDEEERMMTATSGRSLSALSTKSDPLGSLVIMLLESSRWSSRARFLRWQVKPLYSTKTTEFNDTDKSRPSPLNGSAVTLRVWDMPSNRLLFQLAPLELHIDATECSSSEGIPKWTQMNGGMLPTPRAMEVLETPKSQAERLHDRTGNRMNNLQSAAAFGMLNELLPTTTAQDNPHPTGRIDENGRRWTENAQASHSRGLADLALSQLLPTPRSNKVNGCDLNNPNLAERSKSNLEEEIAKIVVSQGGDDGKTSQLSPLFTEEMMGFPLMWTTLPFLSASGEPKASRPTATP